MNDENDQTSNGKKTKCMTRNPALVSIFFDEFCKKIWTFICRAILTY